MHKKWWKESVVYQIYPRSFCDGNGDGIGDLRGIIQKLDYLKELGVNVVWLSPVYQSPNDDNGYDISDYRNINPEFGTLADWEEMIAELHARGIKLVMDLVVNHTSDEHPWFKESRKSKDNPYRDYYIWRAPKDGREPNNWASFFSGSAWKYDELTDEYFLHLFSRKQPDLNWENPRLRAEIYDMMHWWLKKGVDGFRMDVINMISKLPGLPDAPIVTQDRYQFYVPQYVNGPRLIEFLTEMEEQVLSKYDLLTVGETPNVTPSNAVAITNEETGSLSMVFQFQHMEVDHGFAPDSSQQEQSVLILKRFKEVMTHWQKEMENQGWNSLYLCNHDHPRSVSRFGDDGEYRVESAKMLGTFLHFMHGTPYVYQGEEIGMTNAAFPSIDDYRDIEALNLYHEQVVEKGNGPASVLTLLHKRSRDNARTPMQWNNSPQAGFSTVQPWIKVNPNYAEINVKQAQVDPNSIFHYYQKLISLRKENPVMIYGTYDLILPEHDQIYAYTRTLADDRLLVVLNFSAETPVFNLPESIRYFASELLISNYPVDPAEDISWINIRPFEARVYRLK